jgi:hypothetical protein
MGTVSAWDERLDASQGLGAPCRRLTRCELTNSARPRAAAAAGNCGCGCWFGCWFGAIVRLAEEAISLRVVVGGSGPTLCLVRNLCWSHS